MSIRERKDPKRVAAGRTSAAAKRPNKNDCLKSFGQSRNHFIQMFLLLMCHRNKDIRMPYLPLVQRIS